MKTYKMKTSTMKTISLLCSFLIVGASSFSQSLTGDKMKHMMDSAKEKYLDQLAWRNPLLRQAGLSTEVFARGDIKSNMKGSPFFTGKYQIVRTNAYFNAPLLHFKKNIISGGLAVSHQTLHLSEVISQDSTYPVGEMQVHNTLVGASLTFLRIDSLFKKQVVYSVTPAMLIDPSTGQYRFSATGLISFTLRRTQNTSFSLGLLGVIDPSIRFPVIPFVSLLPQI